MFQITYNSKAVAKVKHKSKLRVKRQGEKPAKKTPSWKFAER